MSYTEVQPKEESKGSIATSLLLLVAFVFLGLFVGQFLGALVVFVLFEFDLAQTLAVLSNPTEVPGARTALLTMQAGGALLGYVLMPIVHQQLVDRTPFTEILSFRRVSGPLLATVVLLVIVLLPAVIYLAEWNTELDFSPLSPTFHEWAATQEAELGELLEFITRFDTLGGLMGGLIVIAVLPGLGEEILFRGVLQRRLYPLVGNPHVAIWTAAVIFSAIHIQFFGFFPRLLLGAVFGYIYYWSGSLWYAIVAHFVYNGTTLVMLYLYQQGMIEADIDAAQSVSWSLAALSAGAGAALLFFFRRQTESLPADE